MGYSELIKKQRAFFNSGATRSFDFRRTQLTKLRDVLLTNDQLIFDAIFKDLRRPANQTKMMEFDRIIMEIDYALEHLEEWMKPEEKQPEPFGTPFIYHDPLGVVLVISPFNFPAVLALRPIINAIAAGNTVVLKPSEVAANTAKALGEVLKHFDEEFIAVVQGDAPATIALLEERFDHIFYTGSPGIARSIMTQAAKYLTPVTLELGGKCPAVVLKDAPLEQAIQSITHGKATDYVLVEAAIKPQFLEQLKKAIGSKFRAQTEGEPRLHARLQDLLTNTKGKLVYKPEDENDLSDLYIGPHVFEVEPTDVLMGGEIFGPILPVLTVENLQEAIDFINRGEKPLNAYIFTVDDKKIEKFLTETYSANAVSNGAVLNYYCKSMQLPFGGVGESGMGAYHGKFGFDTFTHQKAVVKAAHP
ncbi:Aldehyde dehydrogenase [Aphelenchoides fujianensis]|nr:Aldehyde dehydrogenase [Aphelenchoides fujianensis]